MKSYYQVLGIDKGADQEEIKRAFRRKASLCHPDHNPHQPKEAEEKFKEVHQAYEVLRDEARRRQYDRLIQRRRSPGRSAAGEDFLGRSFTASDILEELLKEFAARSIILDEFSRSKLRGCGRGRGPRCRWFYSDDET